MVADYILLVPALATTGGTATAAYLWQRTRDRELRKDLTSRLDAILNDARRQTLDVIGTRNVDALVFDHDARDEALVAFLELQKIASSVTDNPRLWDKALAHDDHERVRLALERARPLLQMIRSTVVPLNRRVWNGHRAKAFDALIKALRIKFETPQ